MNANHNYQLKPLFLERMKELLKKDFEEYIKILKQKPVRSIRCNTLKISSQELKERLENKGWKINQPWKDYPEIMIVEGKYICQGLQIDIAPKSALPDFSVRNMVNTKKNSKINIFNNNNLKNNLVINKLSLPISSEASEFKFVDLEPGESGRALEHILGYYYVQELASMLPIIALQPEPNEIILDLCSSPGSKTTQIASKMKNTGTIIANEVKLGRIKILASNLERCGVTNSIITRKDGIEFCRKMKQEGFLFDKILVDAPCSGEGTLRGSPKTSLMWNINTINNLSKLQKSLVASALQILKPNGELVYSTCTHAPEENEEVVDFILSKFPNVKIQEIIFPLKSREGIINWKGKNYNPEVKKAHRIYPQDNNTEGFFIAKFKKLK